MASGRGIQKAHTHNAIVDRRVILRALRNEQHKCTNDRSSKGAPTPIGHRYIEMRRPKQACQSFTEQFIRTRTANSRGSTFELDDGGITGEDMHISTAGVLYDAIQLAAEAQFC